MEGLLDTRYEPFNRKYRPNFLKDVVGQRISLQILKNSLQYGKILPVYLLHGQYGSGKTTVARLLAKAINCINYDLKTGESCNTCISCQEIIHRQSIDVLEIDAASHTQVDKIREVIINSSNLSPVRNKYKIFIIDEVHMLSNHSFNALLKILEEPPQYMVFIFATTEIHKIPNTIVSRCQSLHFSLISKDDMTNRLLEICEKEQIEINLDAIHKLVSISKGSMRDAIALLEKIVFSVNKQQTITVEQVENFTGVIQEEFLNKIIDNIIHSRRKEIILNVQNLKNHEINIDYLIVNLEEKFISILEHKHGVCTTPLQLSVAMNEVSYDTAMMSLQLLGKCTEKMRYTKNPYIVLEYFMLRMCQKLIPFEEILEKINQLEIKISSAEQSNTIDTKTKQQSVHVTSGEVQNLKEIRKKSSPVTVDTSSIKAMLKNTSNPIQFAKIQDTDVEESNSMDNNSQKELEKENANLNDKINIKIKKNAESEVELVSKIFNVRKIKKIK